MYLRVSLQISAVGYLLGSMLCAITYAQSYNFKSEGTHNALILWKYFYMKGELCRKFNSFYLIVDEEVMSMLSVLAKVYISLPCSRRWDSEKYCCSLRVLITVLEILLDSNYKRYVNREGLDHNLEIFADTDTLLKYPSFHCYNSFLIGTLLIRVQRRVFAKRSLL